VGDDTAWTQELCDTKVGDDTARTQKEK
jgi:hypothetical protein